MMRSSDSRYSRQVRFLPWGEPGQARLTASRVAIAGCGALGTVQAEILTRAGVGMLRIIDRDIVEWSNLQRQFLFSEADLRARAFVKDLCRETGLALREDAVGNPFARWAGESPELEPVGTGSHIDAIPNALCTDFDGKPIGIDERVAAPLECPFFRPSIPGGPCDIGAVEIQSQ